MPWRQSDHVHESTSHTRIIVILWCMNFHITCDADVIILHDDDPSSWWYQLYSWSLILTKAPLLSWNILLVFFDGFCCFDLIGLIKSIYLIIISLVCYYYGLAMLRRFKGMKKLRSKENKSNFLRLDFTETRKLFFLFLTFFILLFNFMNWKFCDFIGENHFF